MDLRSRSSACNTTARPPPGSATVHIQRDGAVKRRKVVAIALHLALGVSLLNERLRRLRVAVRRFGEKRRHGLQRLVTLLPLQQGRHRLLQRHSTFGFSRHGVCLAFASHSGDCVALLRTLCIAA